MQTAFTRFYRSKQRAKRKLAEHAANEEVCGCALMRQCISFRSVCSRYENVGHGIQRLARLSFALSLQMPTALFFKGLSRVAAASLQQKLDASAKRGCTLRGSSRA